MLVDSMLFLPFFLFLFAGVWFGITHLITRATKWHELEDRFPNRPEMETVSMRMQSGIFKASSGIPVTLTNCLRLEICPSGLHVSMWKIFGPFRSPFFVPWEQIKASQVSTALLPRIQLVLGVPEISTLILSKKTADTLAENSSLEIEPNLAKEKGTEK